VSTFIPLAEMNHTRADVILVFVYPNTILFGAPVDDPLFAAHKVFSAPLFGRNESGNFYFPDRPGGVLGCAIQVRPN